jgi:ribulose-phosphate 3-epimerase
MCCDLCRLEESVRDLEALGVDCLHLDIMDGRFTPNMPLGLEELRQLRSRTPLAFDAHLMVEDNDFFVRRMIEIGVQRISVHVESAVHLDRTLALIRDNGVQAGAALNPATPLSHLEYVIDRLDFVLIMTVNPGFAGQKLIHSTLRKIAACRALLRDRTDAHIPIQVDGNVSFANIPPMVAAGANILVAGSSSLFHTGGSLSENIEKTRQAVAAGLSLREHEPC